MKNHRLPVSIIITAFVLLSCRTVPDLVVKDFNPSPQQYSAYFGLNFTGISHKIDFVDAAGFSIAMHKFQPAAPAGTVILIHGYYDHTGLEKNLIGTLLEEQLEVVAFDLPGHGLSSGKRASIESFSQYTEVFKAVAEMTLKECPQPQHVIGHSTGASVIIDCALHEGLEQFSRMVLVSPLVRINLWDAAKIGSFLAEIFTDEIPRGFRDNSTDQAYLDFIRNRDPLQYRGVPLNWYDALVEWNEDISGLAESDKPLLIVQGRDDSIVDYNYNLNFIRKKFPNTEIVFIEEARHQLYNETPRLREKVFSEILKYLM